MPIKQLLDKILMRQVRVTLMLDFWLVKKRKGYQVQSFKLREIRKKQIKIILKSIYWCYFPP